MRVALLLMIGFMCFVSGGPVILGWYIAALALCYAVPAWIGFFFAIGDELVKDTDKVDKNKKVA
jgi:hypothetical protein